MQFEDTNALLTYLRNKHEEFDIYIYGAGSFGNTFGIFFNQNGILWHGYIDKNPSKVSQKMNGRNIYDINYLKNTRKNVLIVIGVMSFLYGEILRGIKETLLLAGIEDSRILCPTENPAFCNELLLKVKKPDAALLKLRTLKDKFINRRCFLIGNGPSLSKQDLVRIKDEVTFGCNSLIEYCKDIEMKPTVYCFGDPLFVEKAGIFAAGAIKNIPIALTTVNMPFYDTHKDVENLYFYFCRYELNEPFFEQDITKGICRGETTLYQLLQIAVYMGITEVYLLGVDFTFAKVMSSSGKLIVNDKIRNHPEGMPSPKEAVYDAEKILLSWKYAKAYADTHGIKIYNATRGGALEVFPRVDFDTLFTK